MKRKEILVVFLMSFIALFCSPVIDAQEILEGYMEVDSVIYRPVSAVDTTLAGKDIMQIMPSRSHGADADVNVSQSQEVAGSMRMHVSSNGNRTISGYRVRIFFDNKQTARAGSEETLKKFKGLFPDVQAYRIYANPYFKVTVGDFRTKSEAMALLARIKEDFPSAFVVKENIEYPVVDRRNAVVADTIKVLRPIVSSSNQ